MLPAIGQKGKTVLVICIDRDNDLEKKAGIKGPIIGREKNLQAAQKLALRDPADSDVNAIFKAVQIFDNIKKKGSTEVVTLTGDVDVGIVSDRNILMQLDKILKKRRVNEAILVTDGAEDEYILPLIRSRIERIYPQKIVVKQNSQLEGAYYLTYEFITSILSNKKASRIFVGLPAIAILIYAAFGSAGGRLILGIVGAYLLVKGFQLDPLVDRIAKEVNISLKVRKASFFLYLVSFAFLVLGGFSGYNTVKMINTEDVVLNVAYFIHSSVFLFFVSAVLAGLGKWFSEKKVMFTQYMTYFVLTFAISWIVYETSSFVLSPQMGYNHILSALFIGGAMVWISSLVEKKISAKKRP